MDVEQFEGFFQLLEICDHFRKAALEVDVWCVSESGRYLIGRAFDFHKIFEFELVCFIVLCQNLVDFLLTFQLLCCLIFSLLRSWCLATHSRSKKHSFGLTYRGLRRLESTFMHQLEEPDAVYEANLALFKDGVKQF